MAVNDVNNEDMENGCYVGGSWGHYGTQHLLDQFPQYATDAERNMMYIMSVSGRSDGLVEQDADTIVDINDAVVERINDALPSNQVAHWHDGEFFISPTCEWCDGDSDCDNEECGMH